MAGEEVKFFIIATAEEKPDIFSRLIQKTIKTNYSHAGVLVECLGLGKIYHATRKGFHEIDLVDFLPGHIIRHKIQVYPENPSYAIGWLHGCIGTPYSQIQLLGFIFPWFKKLFRNKRAQTICSEVVIDFQKDCLKWSHELMKDPDYKSPKDVIEITLDCRGLND